MKCESGPSLPGHRLLRLARYLFHESLIVTVIEPTLADYQRELAAADSPLRRARVTWRAYRAFWTIFLMALVAPWAFPPTDDDRRVLADVLRLGVGAVTLGTLIVVNPVLASLIAVLGVAGTVCALLIHDWNERHPVQLPSPTRWLWKTPQINFSAMDVPSNVGGLIFVIGTVVILIVGLPAIVCFLLAGTIAGCVLARGMVEWRLHHAAGDSMTRRIFLR